MDTIERRIKIATVRNGLFMGAILLVVNISSFYYVTNMAGSPVMFVVAPMVFSFAIPIALIVLFCFNTRKRIGGFWNFRQAVTGIFIMFLMAYAIQTIGRDLIFARFIEPNMMQKTETAAINATASMMKGGKYNQKQIDQKIADLKKDFSSQKAVTVGNVIQGLVFSIIFIFVFALIFSALFKREPPVYATPAEAG